MTSNGNSEMTAKKERLSDVKRQKTEKERALKTCEDTIDAYVLRDGFLDKNAQTRSRKEHEKSEAMIDGRQENVSRIQMEVDNLAAQAEEFNQELNTFKQEQRDLRAVLENLAREESELTAEIEQERQLSVAISNDQPSTTKMAGDPPDPFLQAVEEFNRQREQMIADTVAVAVSKRELDEQAAEIGRQRELLEIDRREKEALTRIQEGQLATLAERLTQAEASENRAIAVQAEVELLAEAARVDRAWFEAELPKLDAAREGAEAAEKLAKEAQTKAAADIFHAQAEMQRVEARQTEQNNRERGLNDRETGLKAHEDTVAQLKAAADESLAKVEQTRQTLRTEETAARERADLYAQSLQKSREDIDAANRSLVELQEKIRARQIEMEEVTAKLTKVRSDLAATMADITIEEAGATTFASATAVVQSDSQPTIQSLEQIFDKLGFPRMRLLLETDSAEQIGNLAKTVKQLEAQKEAQNASLQQAMRGAPPEQISWLRHSLQRVTDQADLMEQLGVALKMILGSKQEVFGLNTTIHHLEDQLETLREEKGEPAVHSWNTSVRLGRITQVAAKPMALAAMILVLLLGVVSYRAEIGAKAGSLYSGVAQDFSTAFSVASGAVKDYTIKLEKWRGKSGEKIAVSAPKAELKIIAEPNAPSSPPVTSTAKTTFVESAKKTALSFFNSIDDKLYNFSRKRTQARCRYDLEALGLTEYESKYCQ